MRSHMNVPGEGSIGRISRLLDNLQRVKKWADKNVRECHFDCSDSATITLDPFGDGGHVVRCPLFSKKCPRGEKFIEKLTAYARNKLPPDFPTSFMDRLLDPNDTPALCGAANWNGKGFLYLYGGTGTGKSFAAAWRVFDDNRKQLMAYWDSPMIWPEKFSCRAKWYSAFAICLERANLYSAEEAPMLVIDDLGCESESNTNKAILNELIGIRYNFGRPTIITTNLSISEFSSRYQARMYERILESNNFVNSGDDSLRLFKEKYNVRDRF